MLCIARYNGQIQIHSTKGDEQQQLVLPDRKTDNLYSQVPALIRINAKNDLLVVAYKSGLLAILVQMSKTNRGRKRKLLYFDALETLSIIDMVLADNAFYVGTNAGVVSKFTIAVRIFLSQYLVN